MAEMEILQGAHDRIISSHTGHEARRRRQGPPRSGGRHQLSPLLGEPHQGAHRSAAIDLASFLTRSPSHQVLYGVNQRLRTEDVDSPLCNVRPVKTVMMVVVTGDRGLCGGYNNFVIKAVRAGGEAHAWGRAP